MSVCWVAQLGDSRGQSPGLGIPRALYFPMTITNPGRELRFGSECGWEGLSYKFRSRESSPSQSTGTI